MQKKGRTNQKKYTEMKNGSWVIPNITGRKFKCISENALYQCSFIELNKIYLEANLDMNGQPSQNMLHNGFILLIIKKKPFYISQQYLEEVEKESFETRKILTIIPFYEN